jgi:hypothetical protein
MCSPRPELRPAGVVLLGRKERPTWIREIGSHERFSCRGLSCFTTGCVMWCSESAGRTERESEED